MNNTLSVPAVFREVFEERTKRNPRYSLRAFARDLEVSPGFLSRMLSGKKATLSFRRAVDLGRRLKLDEQVERRLVKAAALGAIRDLDCRRFLAAGWGNEGPDNQFHVVELDQFRALAEWHHLAILDLSQVASFNPSIPWIAEQLQITTAQVESAVERLVRLKLLVIEEDGTWRKTNSKIVIPTKQSDPAVREHHKQMMERAVLAMEREGAREFSQRKVISSTLAIGSKHIAKAQALIEQFRTQLMEMTEKGGAEEVYQLNIQFFRHTQKALTPSKDS